MSRPGDVNFGAAYSSALAVSVIYRDTNGTPFDVTGYAARFEVATYDGSLFGARRLSYASPAAISVGTTNGLFVATIPGADLLSLATWCGNPPGTEPALFRMWITPPADPEFEVAHGAIRLYEAGTVVSNPTLDVTEDEYTATLTAIGGRGLPGATGATGATGPPGDGVAPQTGKVNTATTTATLIRSLAMTLDRRCESQFDVTARRTTDGAVSSWVYKIISLTLADGTTTLEPAQLIAASDPSFLGAVSFVPGAASVGAYANAGDATSTDWSCNARVLTAVVP